jgi:hypothetical protein
LIGLLVLSSLWVVITFLPLLYSILFPPRDIQEIVRALEERGTVSPQIATAVQETIASTGPLRRAVQVGYYSESRRHFTLTLRVRPEGHKCHTWLGFRRFRSPCFS